MQNWSFNPDKGENAVSENDEIVFYIDDLNPEVVAKIVELQNANPNGDFRTQVDQYLESEDRCSPDEREFVLDQIDNYVKLSQASTDDVNNAGPQQPVQQGPGTDPASVVKPEPQPQQPSTNANADKGTASEPQKPATTGNRRGSQTGNRTGGTGTGRATASKSVTSDELIKQLEDKIALIKLLDKTPEVEVPNGLGKTSREIMVDFQRDFSALKETYMERVKTM